MSTANEYRLFAEECLRWARSAKTEDERKAFLDMARTWTIAARNGVNGHEPQAPEPPSGCCLSGRAA
jgi:hypothetical protein